MFWICKSRKRHFLRFDTRFKRYLKVINHTISHFRLLYRTPDSRDLVRRDLVVLWTVEQQLHIFACMLLFYASIDIGGGAMAPLPPLLHRPCVLQLLGGTPTSSCFHLKWKNVAIAWTRPFVTLSKLGRWRRVIFKFLKDLHVWTVLKVGQLMSSSLKQRHEMETSVCCGIELMCYNRAVVS